MRDFSAEEKNQLLSLGVASVYLFGSRAEGAEGADSDFDLAILMENPRKIREAAYRLGVYEKLYDLLTEVTGSESLDIVFLQADVSLELQGHVVCRGKVLWDANPMLRADYEQYVMIMRADMEAIIRQFDAADMERLRMFRPKSFTKSAAPI